MQVPNAATGRLNVIVTQAAVAGGALLSDVVGGKAGPELDLLGAHRGAILNIGEDGITSVPPSSTIEPAEVAGKTQAEFDQRAQDSGIPKSPNPQGGLGPMFIR